MNWPALTCLPALALASMTALAGDLVLPPPERIALRPWQTTPAAAGRAPADRLSASIAAAARPGWIERGVEGSREALLECNKGDYPGGGMGLMSLPFARPSALTDHCRRF